MNQYIKEYLDWKGTYASRASIAYRIWIERFVEVCGNKPIEEYDIGDFIKYKHWLETRFKSYSLQFATIVIKNFFQYYKDQNYACRLVPSLIKLPRITAKSHRAITEGEFKKIVSTIPQNEFIPLRDTVLIRMLWDTGVRVSELCDIDLTQIDENKRSAIISTKKTGKKRIIVWSEETHYYLMRYMPIRLELHNINKATALFVGWHHNKGWSSRLTTRTVQREIKEYVNRAGIKERITPHSFRHGWAHKRRDQNAPLSFIQRGLGHQNPISTFIYEQYNDLEFERNANTYLKAA
jgi:site-specific recombinase XerD